MREPFFKRRSRNSEDQDWTHSGGISCWKAGMTYLCNFGLVGAHAQPIVLEMQASAVPAMEPTFDFPHRRPAMMVSRSNTRFPLTSHSGHRFEAIASNPFLQRGHCRCLWAERKEAWSGW